MIYPASAKFWPEATVKREGISREKMAVPSSVAGHENVPLTEMV
jgi:hypothetical protein